MGITNIKINETEENPLIERKEIKAVVSFSGATPSRVEMRQKIAEKIGANPDTMTIAKTRAGYGKTEVECYVHVYKSADEMKKNEPEYLIKRFEKKEEKQNEKK